MALRDVLVEIVTEKREFPVGTVQGKFVFELFDKAGTKLATKEVEGASAVFPSVNEGDGYNVRVSANGVSVSKGFDIPVTSVFLDVPVAVSVSW